MYHWSELDNMIQIKNFGYKLFQKKYLKLAKFQKKYDQNWKLLFRIVKYEPNLKPKGQE